MTQHQNPPDWIKTIMLIRGTWIMIGTNCCQNLPDGADLCVILDDILLLKLVEHANERRQDRLVADAHEIGECRPEVLRRLLEMVVRNLGEHVVHLVRPDAVDHLVDEPVVAVDGRQLPADEVPVVVGVPRDVDLAVVQERDDDDVAAEQEERDDVVDGERQEAVVEIEEERQVANDGHRHERRNAPNCVTDKHRFTHVEVVHWSWVVTNCKIDDPADTESKSRQKS